MDSFCSLFFLALFVPAATALYGIAPRRARPAILLGLSYLCFWLISGMLVIALVATTLTTYLGGLALEALLARRKRACRVVDRSQRTSVKRRFQRYLRLTVAIASTGSLGILIAVKYLPFFARIASSLLELVGVGGPLVPPRLGMPIGISFYTLQALSYLIDVMNARVPAERNPMRLALFLGFFPQLMEGPVCRYEQTSAQLMAGPPLRLDNIELAAVRIAWGAAKILIVADRVNLFVKPVFTNPVAWSGTVIFVAAVLYTLQLYCDFSGTMDIVLGVARIFNVQLPENFRQPFFSRTASEFWERWHITLGMWLRDYVFYPVSLSAPVKHLARVLRRRLGMRLGSVLSGGVALLSVWTLNGLWHGAGWQYLFFGMYYFALILGAGLAEPLFQRLRRRLGINADARAWCAFQIARTCLIVVVGELFFRAEGLRAGFAMFRSMVTSFSPAAFADGSLLAPGMDIADFTLVGLFVLLLLAVDVWRERGGHLPAGARHHAPALAAAMASVLVLGIVIFGAYGAPYVPLDPIYAQF